MSLRTVVDTHPAADGVSSEVRRMVRDLAANPLLDCYPDGVLLVFDAHLRYVGGTGTAMDDAAPFRSDVIGRTIFEVHPPGLADTLAPMYRTALAGEPLGTVVEIDEGAFELRLRAVRNDDGAVIAGMCFAQRVPENRLRIGRPDDQPGDVLRSAAAVFDEPRRRVVELVGRTGFWHMEVATGRLTWSTGVFAIWGIDAESFDGEYETAMAIIHPDDLQATETAVSDCATNGTPMSVRFRITRVNDGALRWIQSLGEAVWVDGAIVWVGGAVADITEQVQAELDAVAAAAFQRAVFSASPDSITVYDFPTQSAVWANRRLTDELGYSDDEVAGWADNDSGTLTNRIGTALVFAEDRAQLEESLTAAHRAAEDGVVHVQYRMHHRDGSLHWFSQSTAPLARDDTGSVTQIVAVVRDITEAKAGEAALQESETRFRQLADNVDVGFVLRSWDDPPEYLYVNPGFERIFGWNPMTSSEPETDPFAHIHPEELDHFLEHYWTPAMKGLPTQAEYRIIRPDGEERWVRSILSPVRDESGNLRRTASTTEDITLARQAAAAMITGQAAEKANTAKNEFLSRMSHELRTPLNAVMGFAQLLELDQLSKDQHIAVRHIVRGGQHLVNLINDVLDISKIEGDRLDMSLEMVPVARLVQETVDLMTPQAIAAGITLDCRTHDALGRSVYADHRRLRQVVLNLLSNAIKYNRPGGRIDIACSALTPARLDIVVTDTGNGIRAEDLPRLFIPFDRIDAAAAGIEGTGVGLALSQRLMLHMGGTLTVRSRVGEGSVFTATIPIRADSLVDPADPGGVDGETGSDHAPGVTRQPVGQGGDDRPAMRRTVLYIEDNSSNIALMERVIARRRGWDLHVAGHGALGVELMMSIRPDLLLLDLHLPDMDGFEVLRRISTLKDSGRTDVVVVTADANPHQRTRLIQAGADDWLTKPLDVHQLLGVLDRAEQHQLST